MADIPSKPDVNKIFIPDTTVSSFYFDYHIEEQKGFDRLLFVTFVHSDEDCKYLWFKKHAIRQKYEFINFFLLFPFIDETETPFELCIERDYINRLVTVHGVFLYIVCH
jgi:hypothetical protein